MKIRYDGDISPHCMKHKMQKENLSEMRNMQRQQIANTFTYSAKEREEKFQELEIIRRRIVKTDNTAVLGMDENTISGNKCTSKTTRPGRTRDDVERGDSDGHESSEILLGTDNGDIDDVISTGTSASKKDASISSTDNLSSTSEDSDAFHGAMVATPSSSLQSDDGPLGVSITTWKMKNLNRSPTPILSTERSQKFLTTRKTDTNPSLPLHEHDTIDQIQKNWNEDVSILCHKTSTSEYRYKDRAMYQHDDPVDIKQKVDSLYNDVDAQGNVADHSSKSIFLEEYQLTFGNEIEVQTHFKKSVRFMGVKPSVEDNLNRAKNLLASANGMNKRSVRVYDRKPRYIPK